jgi:glycogen operon protein
VLGVYLGKSIQAGDDEPADDLFLVFNAGGDCAFTLPAVNRIEQWQRIADTGAEEAFSIHPVEGAAMVYGASVAVFCPMTKEIEQAGGKSERRRWFHLGRLLGR